MFLSPEQAIDQIITWKYPLIFLITVLEGPVISVISGLLTSQGILAFWLAYLVAVIGDATGDVIYYCLGRWGKDWFIRYPGRLIRVTEKEIAKIERQYENYGGRLVMLSKLAHGIGPAFLVAAGAAKMPFGKFIASCLLAALPLSLTFLTIGYYYGDAFNKISRYLDAAAVVTFFIAVAISLGYFGARNYFRGLIK